MIGKPYTMPFLTDHSGRQQMRIEYFVDTDTALINFTSQMIVETKEISENVYVDIDGSGNLVSMTIEHAKEYGSLHEIHYKEMKSQTA